MISKRKKRIKRERSVDDAIDMHSMSKKSGLVNALETIRIKKRGVDNQMRTLHRALRQNDQLDPDRLSQYVKLNQEQRRLRIYEAELMYIRNIL